MRRLCRCTCLAVAVAVGMIAGMLGSSSPAARARASAGVSLTARSASVAGVTSRGPTVIEFAGIARAFARDHLEARRGDRILQVRVTLHRPDIAAVYWIRSNAKTASARRSGGKGAAGLQYYSARSPLDWKSDVSVTKRVREELHPIIGSWIVTFKGSGSETRTASSPGDTQDNPYCHESPAKENAVSNFTFLSSWILSPAATAGGYPDAETRASVFNVGGSGAYTYDELPGCTDMSGAVTLHHQQCTSNFVNEMAFQPRAELSANVDAKGNHRLLVHAARPSESNSSCPVADLWTMDDAGPVAFFHLVTISDRELYLRSCGWWKAADCVERSISALKVGASKAYTNCLGLADHVKPQCKESFTWSGTIAVKPNPPINLELFGDTKGPLEVHPAPGGASRG